MNKGKQSVSSRPLRKRWRRRKMKKRSSLTKILLGASVPRSCRHHQKKAVTLRAYDPNRKSMLSYLVSISREGGTIPTLYSTRIKHWWPRSPKATESSRWTIIVSIMCARVVGKRWTMSRSWPSPWPQSSWTEGSSTGKIWENQTDRVM